MLGGRLRQTANGLQSNCALDLNNSISQVLSDGSNTYLYGLGRIAQQNVVGWQYYQTDALGSVRQLTNAAGAVTEARSYEPFGKQLSAAGNPLTKYAFTGEWQDPTGLIYLRARYYDPATGRFLSKDPVRGLVNIPQTLNPYNYSINNPIMYTDPSGLIAPWDIVDIGSFLWSLYDFIDCPTWGNAGWLALDVIGLLPLIPSVGLIGKLFGRSDDVLRLYRAVSHDELIDIFRIGGFRPLLGRSFEGKWFWESAESAIEFGKKIGDPTFEVVEAKVIKSVVEKITTRYPRWDFIGAARYVEPEFLDIFNKAIRGLRQVYP